MSVMGFLDEVKLGGKTHHKYEYHHYMEWRLRLKKENAGWSPMLISLCFLTMDLIWSTALSSFCRDFPTMMDCIHLNLS